LKNFLLVGKFSEKKRRLEGGIFTIKLSKPGWTEQKKVVAYLSAF